MPSRRVVEAYIGEYASGKSELVVNRALELLPGGNDVTLVDLDFVEPFYTLRPLKAELEARGVNVIAWKTGETKGLGETGGLIKQEARWVLRHPGHIILDVGYGVHGAASLNLVEGAWDSPELKVLAVINIARPMTATVPDIVAYVRDLGRVDALINNSHLGHETRADIVVEGWKVTNQAAQALNLPVLYSTVTAEVKAELTALGEKNIPYKVITRFMPAAMW